ncbi:MAG: hypothetical protein CVV11_00820 [Gammaproteobacteria bacterium HGW-Gammaproteobacteria-15]|nr:MAG: hypothetical protein CVV11_00820 [Gammaproteobacteria bacterium HGW-Gammaproteobacteria-15]
MNNAQQELFLSTLKQQFVDIFTTSKAGKDTTNLKSRTQGFIYVGELLELCSREDVTQLMELQHQAVFGCSIEQRKPSERTKRQQALKAGDYDYFDEPAFNRN